MFDAHRGKKMVLDPLGKQSQMVVSCHVGAGKNLGPLEEQPVLLTTEQSF